MAHEEHQELEFEVGQLDLAAGAQNAMVTTAIPISDVLPGFETTSFYGVGAPRETPKDIVDLLNREINAALADPVIKQRLAELGAIPIAGDAGEFGAMLANTSFGVAALIGTATAIVMPVIFFYFLGAITGNFHGGSRDTLAVSVASDAGFLADEAIARLGARDGCRRSRLFVRLRSADLAAVSPEGTLHLWRFGEAELCVVCVSPNVLEKLARRRTSPGQWNRGSSYAPTAAASSAV